MNVYVGTLVWKWYDNEGQVHKFRIPNSYYVPQGNVRLLSPQHWAKTQNGSCRDRTGIGETTLAHKTTLFWGKGTYFLDVHHGATDNVATFYLAPGYKQFGLYCQQCEICPTDSLDDPIVAQAAGVAG